MKLTNKMNAIAFLDKMLFIPTTANKPLAFYP